MTKRRPARTWLGHYIDHIREAHPRAIVADAPDPLAVSLARDSATADEYREQLDRVARSSRVAELSSWVQENAVRGHHVDAVIALHARRSLIDANLEHRAVREFEPAKSDYLELMDLFEEHLALTYVIDSQLPDHDRRVRDLDSATPRVQSAQRRALRDALRGQRYGFAELLARRLEAFLDGTTTETDDDAYRKALLGRARATAMPEYQQAYADAFDDEVLRAIGHGEPGILRALIQLPALISAADEAGRRAASAASHAITLHAAAGDDEPAADPWESFAAPPIVLGRPSEDARAEDALVIARSLPPSRSRDDVLAVLEGETQADLARRTGRTRAAVSQSVGRGVAEIRVGLEERRPG